MPSSGEKAGQVLREFMKARDPTKTIFKMMGTFLDEGDLESLQLTSAFLDGHLVELIRNDDLARLGELAYAAVIFRVGQRGEILKNSLVGQKVDYQLDHLLSLCSCATKDRDSNFVHRLVRTTECGEELVTTLAQKENKRGMSPQALADALKIGNDQLSVILSTFEKEEVVERNPNEGEGTLVGLGFQGRAYLQRQAWKKKASLETSGLS